jgi:uncharacterized protein
MVDISQCDISIDKDGVWYYGNDEIFRKEVVYFFYQNLIRDSAGKYLIELGNDRCYVVVEDTPFVVKSVYRTTSENDNKEVILLSLSDGTVEELDPETLLVGKDNVLYCSIREREYITRFSRAGYYQIADFIEHDTEKEEYFITINGQSFYIKQNDTT